MSEIGQCQCCRHWVEPDPFALAAGRGKVHYHRYHSTLPCDERLEDCGSFHPLIESTLREVEDAEDE